jgi:hypothetical protein
LKKPNFLYAKRKILLSIFTLTGDTQISQLTDTMELIIEFVPNLFLVDGDDDADLRRNVEELRKNLVDLIKQVYTIFSINIPKSKSLGNLIF